MKSRLYHLTQIVVLTSLLTCFSRGTFAAPVPGIRNGTWQGTISRPDGRQLVISFEVKDSVGKKIIYVLNAGERLLVDKVKQDSDTVSIEMPFFDSGFRIKMSGSERMAGYWIRKLADHDQRMPFTALIKKERFEVTAPPVLDISGRWSVAFSAPGNIVTWSVGEFVQRGNHLTGTFLTTTGDYRYLEGVVTGDSIKLSAFDGSHAYLFTARAYSDTLISGGYFFSGLSGLQKWTARRDAAASLPDGYSETRLKDGESSLNFSFKSMDGKMVSIRDPKYKNKVMVVQLMGSWCPNCMDETAFLSRYYDANRSRGVEIIALAYEITTDYNRSKQSLQKFQARFNTKYPVLITQVAVTDTMRTVKTLPQLTDIKAFPTSIFIDKKGMVRKIYTGYNGPATGAHYDAFVKEFNETINGLLEEKE